MSFTCLTYFRLSPKLKHPYLGLRVFSTPKNVRLEFLIARLRDINIKCSVTTFFRKRFLWIHSFRRLEYRRAFTVLIMLTTRWRILEWKVLMTAFCECIWKRLGGRVQTRWFFYSFLVRQGYPTTVFCKISVRRSKYCRICGSSTSKFPTIFGGLIFHISLPRLGYFS